MKSENVQLLREVKLSSTFSVFQLSSFFCFLFSEGGLSFPHEVVCLCLVVFFLLSFVFALCCRVYTIHPPPPLFIICFFFFFFFFTGATFLVWFGPTVRLTVSDPDLIREIFTSKSEFYEKNEAHPLVKQLEGDGLLSLKGEKWAHHRKIITPTFHMENVKVLN